MTDSPVQVPQPWHASSTLVHEAALGVTRALLDSGKVKSHEEAMPQFREYFYHLIDEQEVGTGGEGVCATSFF